MNWRGMDWPNDPLRDFQQLKRVDVSVFTPVELAEFKEVKRDAKLYMAGTICMFLPALALTFFTFMIGFFLAMPLFYFGYKWMDISLCRARIAIQIYKKALSRINTEGK